MRWLDGGSHVPSFWASLQGQSWLTLPLPPTARQLQDSSPALESPLNSGDTSQLLQQLLAWRLAQGAGDAGTDRAACNGGGGAAVLSPPPLLSPPGPGLLPVAVGIQGATCPLAAVAEELVGALNEPHKSPGGLDPLAPLWGIQGAQPGAEQQQHDGF